MSGKPSHLRSPLSPQQSTLVWGSPSLQAGQPAHSDAKASTAASTERQHTAPATRPAWERDRRTIAVRSWGSSSCSSGPTSPGGSDPSSFPLAEPAPAAAAAGFCSFSSSFAAPGYRAGCSSWLLLLLLLLRCTWVSGGVQQLQDEPRRLASWRSRLLARRGARSPAPRFGAAQRPLEGCRSAPLVIPLSAPRRGVL